MTWRYRIMENAALFENTTLVREKAIVDLGAFFEKKKKTWDKEIMFVLTFIFTSAVIIPVMAWAGMFDVTTPGSAEAKVHIGGLPLVAALCASAAVSLGITVLYALKNREPKLTEEEISKSVPYRYIISEEGIKVEHGYHTDNITYSEIEKITSNGYSYFLYTQKRRYQIRINGFGSKITSFERFLENRGFTIGIEP